MSKTLPPKLADEVWRIAGGVEWDASDWQTFYEGLTQIFLKIAVRHARAKMEAVR